MPKYSVKYVFSFANSRNKVEKETDTIKKIV